MLRIAHISDLHFAHGRTDEAMVSDVQFFSKLAYSVGKIAGPDVVADGHDENKLEALKNVFRLLKPNVIVITGDITNYGDSESFNLAVETIRELKMIAGATHVFCIPGNHDCLAERALALREKGLLTRALIRTLSIFNPTASRLRRLSLDAKLIDSLKEGEGLPLLKTYHKFCANEFGTVDPSKPIFVDAGWGEVAFFLFNSTNDPAFMANEGSIGASQFNALNRFLDDPANSERLASSVCIALLHHHPINNPDIDASPIERFYDEMIDGSRFLEYLGKRKFHFIFHGHQHRQYFWDFAPGLRPHISAAGSALAGKAPTGSFNLIDLITPFEAIYRRFDYTATGFEEAVHAEKTVKVYSLDNIRVSKPSEPKTGEDIAIQSLFAGRKEAFDDLLQYSLLEYDVVISPTQLYQARYRRKGRVLGPSKSYGLTFLVTGNPPRSFEELKATAQDQAGASLFLDCPFNSGTQKLIRVLHPLPVKPGDEFDITLGFEWQATQEYPNHYDAFNLLYFLKGIDLVSYRVRLPWKPAQFNVSAYGLRKSDLNIADFQARQNDDGTYEYAFKIYNPKPLVYLISLGPVA